MVVVKKEDTKVTIELTQVEYEKFRSHLGNYLSIFSPRIKEVTLEEYVVFPMSKVLTDIEEGFNNFEEVEDYFKRMKGKLGKEWYKMI